MARSNSENADSERRTVDDSGVICLKHLVRVERPVEDVWAFLSDPGNLPRWQKELVEVRRDGPQRVGGREVHVRRFLGRTAANEMEFTVYEPPSRVRTRVVAGPLRALFQTVGADFQSVGGGTEIQVVMEGRPRGVFRLLVPLMVRMMRRQIAAEYATLKQLLEET